jgi:hypothetical protein
VLIREHHEGFIDWHTDEEGLAKFDARLGM